MNQVFLYKIFNSDIFLELLQPLFEFIELKKVPYLLISIVLDFFSLEEDKLHLLYSYFYFFFLFYCFSLCCFKPTGKAP